MQGTERRYLKHITVGAPPLGRGPAWRIHGLTGTQQAAHGHAANLTTTIVHSLIYDHLVDLRDRTRRQGLLPGIQHLSAISLEGD